MLKASSGDSLAREIQSTNLRTARPCWQAQLRKSRAYRPQLASRPSEGRPRSLLLEAELAQVFLEAGTAPIACLET
jgi:hypothetical protein